MIAIFAGSAYYFVTSGLIGKYKFHHDSEHDQTRDMRESEPSEENYKLSDSNLKLIRKRAKIEQKQRNGLQEAVRNCSANHGRAAPALLKHFISIECKLRIHTLYNTQRNVTIAFREIKWLTSSKRRIYWLIKSRKSKRKKVE